MRNHLIPSEIITTINRACEKVNHTPLGLLHDTEQYPDNSDDIYRVKN